MHASLHLYVIQCKPSTQIKIKLLYVMYHNNYDCIIVFSSHKYVYVNFIYTLQMVTLLREVS